MDRKQSESTNAPAQENKMIVPDLRPTYLECALMSDHAYQGDKIQPMDTLPDAPGWSVGRTIPGPSGFFAVIFLNDTKKQLVVSYRGTTNLSNLFEDLRGVVMGTDTWYQRKVFEVTQIAIQLAKSKNYNLLFTGHSLGGDSAVRSVFYCHSAFDYPNVQAVVFECPGSTSNIRQLDAHHRPVDLRLLDIVGFVSYPDLVNTFDQHVETLFSLETDLGKRGNWPLIHLKAAHTITKMVAIMKDKLAKNEKLEMLYLSDWPIGSQRSIFFDNRYFNKETGKYLKSPEEIAVENNALFEQDTAKFNEGLATKYAVTYEAHHHVISAVSSSQALPLRHFSSELQKILRLVNTMFLNTGDPNWLVNIKKRLAQKIPEQLVNYLIGGYQLIEMSSGETILRVTLPNVDVHTFRQNLSTWLHESGKSLMQLLELAQQPPKHLIEMISEATGKDSVAMSAYINTDGKSKEQIELSLDAWDRIADRVSKLTTKATGDRSTAIGVSVGGEDPIKAHFARIDARRLAEQQQRDGLIKSSEAQSAAAAASSLPPPSSSGTTTPTPKGGSTPGNG